MTPTPESNAMSLLSEPDTDHCAANEVSDAPDWPAQPLIEARGIVADFVHHPDSLIVLACRAVAAHSPEQQERREALALAGLLTCVSKRKAKGGAA